MDAVASKEQRASAYNGYYRVGDSDHDPDLTRVGPETPGGEFLRRFWHPVCMADRLTDLPQKGSDKDDAKFHKIFGRSVRKIALDTLPLSYEERRREVERRVKQLKAESV